MILQSRLKEILSYNAETGDFTWIKKPYPQARCAVGSTAGSIHKHGYIVIGIDGKQYQASRLAWVYVNGDVLCLFIDHINGNRKDNRISNIRVATQQQNNHNTRNPRSDNSTGYLGVSISRGKFVAQIGMNGHNKFLGYFESAADAHGAYINAKRNIHEFCTI